MIALDTNILVRFFTKDDPDQAAVVRKVMEEPRLWVAKTVVLELEWVLRYTYAYDRQRVLEALKLLIGYPRVEVEDHWNVLRAIRWYASGMDFADALHLASSATAEQFASFDRQMAQSADQNSTRPPVRLLR